MEADEEDLRAALLLAEIKVREAACLVGGQVGIGEHTGTLGSVVHKLAEVVESLSYVREDTGK